MSVELDGCRMIELPKIESESGAMTPVHGGREIPFEIARIFFFYDVVADAERGGHAHRLLEQVIVAAMGAFRVVLDNGRERTTVELRQPHIGLYVPTMVWSQLVDFTSGSIGVVLASRHYDESEYIRDYRDFKHGLGGAA
jgi:hypothetical protein